MIREIQTPGFGDIGRAGIGDIPGSTVKEVGDINSPGIGDIPGVPVPFDYCGNIPNLETGEIPGVPARATVGAI